MHDLGNVFCTMNVLCMWIHLSNEFAEMHVFDSYVAFELTYEKVCFYEYPMGFVYIFFSWWMNVWYLPWMVYSSNLFVDTIKEILSRMYIFETLIPKLGFQT